MDAEKEMRAGLRGRGVSIDLGSPYMLPPGLDRPSLDSTARSADSHDPYRPVTFIKDDYALARSTSRPRNDSTLTGSSGRTNDALNAGLLNNAQRMSQSEPQIFQQAINEKPPPFQQSDSTRTNPPRKASLARSGKGDRWYPSDDKKYGAVATEKEVDDVLVDVTEKPSAPPKRPEPVQIPQQQRVAEAVSRPVTTHEIKTTNLYVTAPSPTHDRSSPAPPSKSQQASNNQPNIHQPIPRNPRPAAPVDEMNRVSVMGLRPLPPDDPSDNPEIRANRIRSFYKEYFDDSRPNPAGQYPQQYAQAGPYDYYEDYSEDLLNGGAVYDPETGAFYTDNQAPYQAPFAQPMGRRAMTPPPRGAASFQRGHRSVASTQSAARGRRFGPGPGPQQIKKLPPPSPLQSLPTPHLLKDDSAIFNPLDFAPRTTFRDRQLGRGPDSPIGTSRPYSPAVSSHLPLASSYDDLAIMPSP